MKYKLKYKSKKVNDTRELRLAFYLTGKTNYFLYFSLMTEVQSASKILFIKY